MQPGHAQIARHETTRMPPFEREGGLGLLGSGASTIVDTLPTSRTRFSPTVRVKLLDESHKISLNGIAHVLFGIFAQLMRRKEALLGGSHQGLRHPSCHGVQAEIPRRLLLLP